MTISKVGVSGLFIAEETLEVLLQSRNLVNSKGEPLSRAPGGLCLPGGRLDDNELADYRISIESHKKEIAQRAFFREMGEESGLPIPQLDQLSPSYIFDWQLAEGSMPRELLEAEKTVPYLTKVFDYAPDVIAREFGGKQDYLYTIRLPREVVSDIASHWQEGRGAMLMPLQFITGIRGIPTDHAMLLYVFADYVEKGKFNEQKIFSKLKVL